jgi:hypothetical protein
MTKRPDLIVRLFAGDVLVDESDDVLLWQKVLGEIRGLKPVAEASVKDPSSGARAPDNVESTVIGAFSGDIEVTIDELVGALDPQSEQPFISLDSKCWEALKKNTPKRGPGGIPPSVLAATALVLWSKHNNLGDISLSNVRAVLGTIHLEDANAQRSIVNCDWLQMKGSRIVLNPARRSSAVHLLQAFCRREPVNEG